MKKGSKPLILFIMFMLITGTVLILGYISVKLKCEELTKQKVLAEDELSAKKNRRVSLTAENQFYSSEERITSIAFSELGMIKSANPIFSIKVDKKKIESISDIIRSKYD
jgi:cell division protein FtsB